MLFCPTSVLLRYFLSTRSYQIWSHAKKASCPCHFGCLQRYVGRKSMCMGLPFTSSVEITSQRRNYYFAYISLEFHLHQASSLFQLRPCHNFVNTNLLQTIFNHGTIYPRRLSTCACVWDSDLLYFVIVDGL